MMKNVCLSKVNILLQFWGEILTHLCSNNYVQILLILPQFKTFGTVKLEGFVWTSVTSSYQDSKGRLLKDSLDGV